jgi:hypothetical protein
VAYHIFDYGPTGRHLLVDSEGRLVVNGDAAISGYIYAYGDTGYPLLVDGIGRLLVNPSGLSGLIPESVQFLYADSDNNYGIGPNLFPNISLGLGTYNIAVGTDVLENLTTGDHNVALGENAGLSAVTTLGAISIGRRTHYLGISSRSISIGYEAGYYGSGIGSISIGPWAGYEQTPGASRNIAIGYECLLNNNKNLHSYNVAIGNNAYSSTNGPGDSNVAIGTSALNNSSGNYNVGIGDNCGNNVTGMTDCIYIGRKTTSHNMAVNVTAIGFQAVASGNNTMRLGDNSIEVQCENLMVQNTINTVQRINMPIIRIGTSAGNLASTNPTNIAIGQTACTALTTGQGNVGIGDEAMLALTQGGVNIGIGVDTLRSNTTGDSNIAIGFEALINTDGVDNNIGIGYQSLRTNVSGANNTALGHQSLYTCNGGDNNTAIGAGAGYSLTTGVYHTCIGFAAGFNLNAGSGIICIGRSADVLGSYTNAAAIGTEAEASGSFTMRLGSSNIEVQCENLMVQQQILHRGCYGELYEDNPAGTTIDITTAGTFYQMPSGYLGQETGNPYVDVVAESGQIRIGSKGEGLYQIHCSLSYGGTVDILSEAAIHVNGGIKHNMHIKRKLSAAGDVGAATLTGMARLIENDFVDIRFTSDSDGDDINLNHANISLHRIAR